MEFLRTFLRLYLAGNQWWLVVSQNIICFFTLGQIQQIFSLKAQQQRWFQKPGPARKMKSLYDLQCKINVCFSTDLDAEIDRPSQELSTMTIWQILIFPEKTKVVLNHLRLIFPRQASGHSRLCLLPFWRTVVVTYSLLLVRLAAKGSPRLSHWYDIVTSDLKQSDPGSKIGIGDRNWIAFSIMGLASSKQSNVLFFAQIAPSRVTRPRILCPMKKCSVNTQTKS